MKMQSASRILTLFALASLSLAGCGDPGATGGTSSQASSALGGNPNAPPPPPASPVTGTSRVAASPVSTKAVVRDSSSEPFLIALQPGWNLFSMPFASPTTFSVDKPADVLSCFAYDAATGSYVPQEFSQAGFAQQSANPYQGYWVFCNGAVQLTLNGSTSAQSPLQTTLAPGWNLVGTPVSGDVATAALQFSSLTLSGAAAGGLLGAQAYVYSPSSSVYQALSYQSGAFPAFQAAWVFAYQSGNLSLATAGLPTGNNVVSGLITDETGAGLAGVTLTVQVAGATQTAPRSTLLRSDTGGLITVTNSSGAFELDNLLVGQTYNVTIQESGRITLNTQITPSASIPNLQILLESPAGSGNTTFSLPNPLLMNPAVSDGSSISLSWQPSVNPGFVGYSVFKSTTPDVATNDTQIYISLSAGAANTTDTVSTTATPTYYRVYEKDLLPELGAFIQVGSNVVSPDFPSIASFAPQGQSLAINTPVQVTFVQAMNESSTNLTMQNGSGVSVNGTTLWSNNTLTFVPTNPLGYSQTYSVSLTGQDAVGDQLLAPSFSFGTTSGISSFLPTGNITNLNTPVQIAFTQAMNETSVALNITSSVPGDVVNGTTSWSGNNVTFTPTPSWLDNRTYAVAVSGQDANGISLNSSPQTFETNTFAATGGYILDPTFGSTVLGSRPTSPTGGAIRNQRSGGPFTYGPYINFAVDREDNPLVVDPENLDVLEYNSVGQMSATLAIPDGIITVDSADYTWGYTEPTNIELSGTLNRYSNVGALLSSLTLSFNQPFNGLPPLQQQPQAQDLGYASIAVDGAQGLGYFASYEQLSPLVAVVNLSTGAAPSRITPNGGIRADVGVAVDSQGFVYTCPAPPGSGITNDDVNGAPIQKLDSSGNLVASFPPVGGNFVTVTVGSDDSAYFFELDGSTGWFWRVAPTEQVVTQFSLDLTTIPGLLSSASPLACALGADSTGRIYLEYNEGQFIRLIPADSSPALARKNLPRPS